MKGRSGGILGHTVLVSCTSVASSWHAVPTFPFSLLFNMHDCISYPIFRVVVFVDQS